jgi:hypothetical protein
MPILLGSTFRLYDYIFRKGKETRRQGKPIDNFQILFGKHGNYLEEKEITRNFLFKLLEKDFQEGKHYLFFKMKTILSIKKMFISHEDHISTNKQKCTNCILVCKNTNPHTNRENTVKL